MKKRRQIYSPEGTVISPTTPEPDLTWITDYLDPTTIKEPVPSILEGVFVKTLIIGSCFLLYFSLNGKMLAIETSLLIILGLYSSILLTLNHRFKQNPEVCKKMELSLEREALKTEAENIQDKLKRLVNDKHVLEQEKIRKVDEIMLNKRNIQRSEVSEITKIDNELSNILSNIKSQKQELILSENNDIANTLKRIRIDFLSRKLSGHNISKQAIPGIGHELAQRLWTNGIKTAADVSGVQIAQRGYGYRVSEVAYIEVPGRGKVHVDGIGPAKAKSLLVWRQQLEGAYVSSAPRSLPETEINAIKSKYRIKRQSLDTQEVSEQQRRVQTKESIKQKYCHETEACAKNLLDVERKFLKQVKALEDIGVRESKSLTNRRYKLGMLENRLKPYLKIELSTYIRRAILF
jgi:DNA-binding helix-hairpin-helix protein with protein kinase domain